MVIHSHVLDAPEKVTEMIKILHELNLIDNDPHHPVQMATVSEVERGQCPIQAPSKKGAVHGTLGTGVERDAFGVIE